MKLDDLINLILIDGDTKIILDKTDFIENNGEIHFKNNFMFLARDVCKYIKINLICKTESSVILCDDPVKSRYLNLSYPYDMQISDKIIRFNYSANIKKMKHISLLL